MRLPCPRARQIGGIRDVWKPCASPINSIFIQHSGRLSRSIVQKMAIRWVWGFARDPRHDASGRVQAGTMRRIVINDAGAVWKDRIQHSPCQVFIVEIAVVPAPSHDQSAVVFCGMGVQCDLHFGNRSGIAQPCCLHNIGATIHKMHMRVLKSGQHKSAACINDARIFASKRP